MDVGSRMNCVICYWIVQEIVGWKKFEIVFRIPGSSIVLVHLVALHLVRRWTMFSSGAAQ